MKHSLLILLMIFNLISNSTIAQSAWYFIPTDVNNLHSSAANETLSYGTNAKQIGELRIPKSKGPHPVIIIIHGGCWTEKFADLHYTAAIADALRDIGYATWNIDYRGVDNKDGGWPGTFNDVAQATDFLRTISKKYALDTNKVIVIGHSAGGHLALWLAGRPNLPTTSPLYTANPLRVRGAISLGGVPDLKNFRTHSVAICGSDVIASLLGNKEELMESRYKETSPAAMLPLKTQQVLMFGTEDKVTPDTLQSYISNAKKSGDAIKLIRIPYAAHFEYTVPNSVAWPLLVHEIQALFNDPPLAIG